MRQFCFVNVACLTHRLETDLRTRSQTLAGLVRSALIVSGVTMEQQILSTLQEIKTAIYILMAIVVLGVVASFLRAGIAAKSLLRGKLDDVFRDEANHLFDKGAFDELINFCE